MSAFEAERALRLKENAGDLSLLESAHRFLLESVRCRYSYNFEWLSRPIIQYPQDIVAMQELIWKVKPDLVIETGIAHGGSIILSASMLAMLDYCDAVTIGKPLDPQAAQRRVLAVDIEIRPHNLAAIARHPMSHRIDMIEGPSTAPEVVARVHDVAKRYKRTLVCLDSNHTHEHVLAELRSYAPLVSPDSYCVVFDTVIENLPEGTFASRPWSRGNSPMTAVQCFLSMLESKGAFAADGERLYFEPDSLIDAKLVISVAPGGYLKRVRKAD